MRRRMRMAAMVMALAVMGAQAQQAMAPIFSETASHLQTGGNFYIVTTFEGVLQTFADQIIDYVDIAVASDTTGEAKQIKEVTTKVIAYLKSSGLMDLQSFGMSTVPRADGDYDMRMFVGAPDSTTKPLLKALFGAAPGRLDAAGFLPPDAVVASADTGSLADLWSFINEGILACLSSEQTADYQKALAESRTTLGIGIDELLGSFGSGGAVALTLSEDTKCYLPSASGPVEIPVPAMVIVSKLASEEASQKLMALEKLGALPLVKLADGDMYARMVPLPLPVPFPFQINYTVADGYLVLGTTPDIVKTAITCHREGGGLVSTEGFKSAFKNRPLDACSGISYSSRRFAEELQAMQTRMMTSNASMQPEAAVAFRRIMTAQGSSHSAVVAVNTGNGLYEEGVTSTGGGEMVASLTVVPIVGIGAAIAIPSFMKARTVSQKNACINNLRQLDGAKEQWALEQNKSNGDEVDTAGVLKYLRGNAMPVCPGGGEYTLGKVGEDPTCSMPRHGLPGRVVTSPQARGMHPARVTGSCLNNLRQIDAAKEQWAMEYRKSDGDAVVPAEVGEYIRGGIPTCPQGGTYNLGKLGEAPTCTVPGHSLH